MISLSVAAGSDVGDDSFDGEVGVNSDAVENVDACEVGELGGAGGCWGNVDWDEGEEKESGCCTFWSMSFDFEDSREASASGGDGGDLLLVFWVRF